MSPITSEVIVKKATRTLPADYREHGSISLTKNKKLMLLLNIVGIPWLALCIGFFLILVNLLRPVPAGGFSIPLGLTAIFLIVGVVVTTILVVTLHELVHGLFYWVFTRERPTFGFKWWYAYAAAPGWYVPRPQFVVVGLAPLVLLTLVGLGVMLLVPWVLVPYLLWGLIVNAGGAIGDLYMVLRLALAPAGVVIEDWANGITWYVPCKDSNGQVLN